MDITLAFRRGLGSVIRSGRQNRFQVPKNARISLLPLQDCKGVNLTGTEWELNNSDLSPSGLESLSNRAMRPNIEVSIRSGAAILFAIDKSLETPSWSWAEW